MKWAVISGCRRVDGETEYRTEFSNPEDGPPSPSAAARLSANANWTQLLTDCPTLENYVMKLQKSTQNFPRYSSPSFALKTLTSLLTSGKLVSIRRRHLLTQSGTRSPANFCSMRRQKHGRTSTRKLCSSTLATVDASPKSDAFSIKHDWKRIKHFVAAESGPSLSAWTARIWPYASVSLSLALNRRSRSSRFCST